MQCGKGAAARRDTTVLMETLPLSPGELAATHSPPEMYSDFLVTIYSLTSGCHNSCQVSEQTWISRIERQNKAPALLIFIHAHKKKKKIHLLLSIRDRAYLKLSGDKMTSMQSHDRHEPEEIPHRF